MEVYVDELPESCKECEYCSTWVDDGNCYQCFMPNEDALMYPNEILKRSSTCPLKSLADHDTEVKKQERERVIDEIKAYYTKQPYDRIPAHTDVRVLLDRLDKIKQEDTSNY